jgi:large subunit ribosomal protein L3
MLGLLGRKIGMTQIFDESGKQIPITVIEAGPVTVTQVKTKETDGYDAVQVAFGKIKEKNVNKPLKGHFAKSGAPLARRLAEFRVDNPQDYTPGQVITADLFKDGQRIDITGTSKGKGTQGHVRRWNHLTGPMAHGSKFHRRPGSLGASATPGRVAKGYPGPGRMGYERVTVQNLTVVRVDAERNLLLVKGAVPGPQKGYLRMKPTVKASK